MANTGLVDLEKELTCSICTELLYQPLTLLDCLHTFCGYCLKEWFSWQGSHPNDRDRPPQFTCPACRASVRDTKHDAKVTTLLDLFLRSHPQKERSAEDRHEIEGKYKPGDIVLPARRSPARFSASQEEDRRLLEEVREMSLRDTQGRGRGRHRESRTSISRPQQGTVSAQALEQQRIEDARRRRRATRQLNTTRSRSPLDRNSNRTSQLEHQSSLRSLLSNPNFTETAIQEEILRQIAEEGLLDGIDLQSLDPDQEEELTERIAEAFRRRQRHRTRSHGQTDESQNSEVSPRIQRSQRSRSQSFHESNTDQVRHSEMTRRPLLESSQYPSVSDHRRSTSDRGVGRRRTSPIPGASEEHIHPATRSATDVSIPSRVRPNSRSRPAVHGETDNGTSINNQNGRFDTRHRRGRSRSDHSVTSSQQHPDSITGVESPISTINLQAPAPRLIDSRTELVNRHRSTSHSSAINQLGHLAVPSPGTEGSGRILPSSFIEPSISCERCGKKDLEYELHKLCARCKNGTYHLCLRCYRQQLGCLHWFGFGDTAQIRFRESQDQLPLEQRSQESPHRLQSRRFVPPSEDLILPITREDGRKMTSSDPLTRLQDGLFCDICQSFANDCFWKCGECNDGEWGFCNSCVNKGKCCTHALLPIAHVDQRSGQMRPSSSDGSSTNPTSTTLPAPDVIFDTGQYRLLTFSTKCNICTYPIPPSVTRFHCPTCNDGDYDICTNCYLKLCASGKISKENGRTGWRRCLKNHRMLIVGFEDHENGQKRVIVRGLVGGYAWKDDLDPTMLDRMSRLDRVVPNGQLTRQDSDLWEWPEASPNSADAASPTKGTKRKLNRSPKSTHAPQYPPSGGVGFRLIATWSYYPEPEDTDEIMFPRGAEITEGENINNDWYLGCYAGQIGLFPGYYANVVEEFDLPNE
ncbi:C3HC4 type zinc-finger (RING finger) protein [Emydomyces testavorans]|uniref:C3HC4 type zinc-finger (RING finger) protein n=1 Tax=Emydomyces testavorans TaxID=2070801 RepID=A0AAF0DF25_9EURO|nr:C3HC4 type zinc-finger (RING finger) protein [Emydomyces testavorans]